MEYHMTEQKIDWFPIMLGALAFIIGAAMSTASGYYSYMGFQRTFPDIQGAGVMGAAFAAATFVTVAALTYFFYAKRYLLCVMIVIFAGFAGLVDAFGNFQAFNSSDRVELQDYSDRLSKYNEAVTAYDNAMSEATRYDQQFETIQQAVDIPSIKEAQHLLKALTLYTGRIDGQLGGLTEIAFAAFGDQYAKRSEELKTIIKNSSEIKALGAPIEPSKTSDIRSKLFAVALTLISCVLSLMSSSLFSLAGEDARRRKAEAEAEEDEQDELITLALEEEILALRRETGLETDEQGTPLKLVANR